MGSDGFALKCRQKLDRQFVITNLFLCVCVCVCVVFPFPMRREVRVGERYDMPLRCFSSLPFQQLHCN